MRTGEVPSALRFLLAAVLAAACAAAQATPSPLAPGFEPLPGFPSQGMRALTDASTSGVLRVRFENADCFPGKTVRTYPAVFLVAGSPKQAPAVRITKGHYYYVRDGRIVAEAGGVPAAGDTAASKLNTVRVTPLGIYRQYQVYGLAVYPEQAAAYADCTTGYWMLDFIEADIDLGAPPTCGAEQAQRAAQFAGFGTETLLNPGIDSSYLQTTTTEEFAGPRQWVDRMNGVMALSSFLLR